VGESSQVQVSGPSRLVLAVATAALVVLTSGATVFLALTGTGDLVRSAPALEPLPSAAPPTHAPVVHLQEASVEPASAAAQPSSRSRRSRPAGGADAPVPLAVPEQPSAASDDRPRRPRPPAAGSDDRPRGDQPSRDDSGADDGPVDDDRDEDDRDDEDEDGDHRKDRDERDRDRGERGKDERRHDH
jgi:hypothetical protein